MPRRYGRAPQGERLVQKVPHGNWKTLTFIAALRHNRVTAPFVLEGAMTGETFKAYIEQCLAPTLRKNDIVFLDNVSVHKVDGIEEAIKQRGATACYLPPYSPDLNPIEQFFQNSKHSFARLRHTVSKKQPSRLTVSARPSPTASAKSCKQNAPHISQIQGMVNLNGKRSNARGTCVGNRSRS